MEGGARIGEGSYGCVFDKPLLCKDGRHFQGIGKVSGPEDAENELTFARLLAKIPNAAEYFVLINPASKCDPIAAGKQPDVKGVKECKIIQKEGMNGLIHYTMPYGGISIGRIIHRGLKMPDMVSLTKHILEAASLMAFHGLVHFDVHPGNILIQKGVPRFIDFGMAFTSKEISEYVLGQRWKQINSGYFNWDYEPPEVTCITGVRSGMSFQDTILEILNSRQIIRSAEVALGLSRKRQLRNFIRFWNSSVAIKRSDWVSFFKLYWPAYDAWSIGAVLLPIYITVKPDLAIKEVLRGLLQIDPRRRLDCVEALATLDPENYIVNSPSGKQWLAEKGIIRAAFSEGS